MIVSPCCRRKSPAWGMVSSVSVEYWSAWTHSVRERKGERVGDEAKEVVMGGLSWMGGGEGRVRGREEEGKKEGRRRTARCSCA